MSFAIQLQRIRQQKAALKSEAADAKRKAAKFDTPASFAQAAKLQRKAIATEKQQEKLSMEEVSSCWHHCYLCAILEAQRDQQSCVAC